MVRKPSNVSAVTIRTTDRHQGEASVAALAGVGIEATLVVTGTERDTDRDYRVSAEAAVEALNVARVACVAWATEAEATGRQSAYLSARRAAHDTYSLSCQLRDQHDIR